MPSAAQVLGVTVIITWKGSQCKVCQHCKVEGHWARECNPALRALTINKQMQKLPPAPLQAELNQPTQIPPQPTPTQPQPTTQPTPTKQTANSKPTQAKKTEETPKPAPKS